jgi:hypothetical protein
MGYRGAGSMGNGEEFVEVIIVQRIWRRSEGM